MKHFKHNIAYLIPFQLLTRDQNIFPKTLCQFFLNTELQTPAVGWTGLEDGLRLCFKFKHLYN